MTDPFLEQGLPSNIEAERSILGAILLDNSVCAQAIELLKRNDFFLDSHRRIFERMVEMFQKQWPIDLVTLSDTLRQTGEFEQVGGATYIASLIDGVPRTDNLDHYARLIIKKATARALLTAANHIQAMCFDDPDREDLDSEAQRMIFEAIEDRGSTPWLHLGDAAWKYLEEIEEMADKGGTISGIQTGIRELDYKLLGLQRQELIVLAGRPSQGKTSLSFDLTKRSATAGARCAYFSLEMGARRIGEKGIASEAELNSWRMRGGGLNRDEWSRAGVAALNLKKLGVWLCDDARLSTAQMRAKLHRLRSKQGAVDLIVVDYLKLLQLKKRRDLRQELGEATAELKQLAKEFNACVMLLHQLNRETTKGTTAEPELQHLAESGDIEAHADVVLFIYRHDEQTMIKVAKNRNGPVGKFPILYVKEHHRFDNFPDHAETAPMPYKDD